MYLLDRLNRPLKDLRVSVTDRCNFRCQYCMPHDEYEWIAKNEILSFEELVRVGRIFARLGVERLRLTGGEPLVRRDLATLVGRLAGIEELTDIGLTTNGALLTPELAHALAHAGLNRINVSLDTLREDRFERLTKRGRLHEVLAGVRAAQTAGLTPVKINAVIMRGVNDDEILDLFNYARDERLDLRFIEYMDVGNVNAWSLEKTVTQAEILDVLSREVDLGLAGRIDGRAPSLDFSFEEGRVGIISSVTRPFCGTCSRVRLTADGKLVTCLFASGGFDLRELLRSGFEDGEIAEAICQVWRDRTDRYSEERLESILNGDGDRPDDREKIEMIRLGG